MAIVVQKTPSENLVQDLIHCGVLKYDVPI